MKRAIRPLLKAILLCSLLLLGTTELWAEEPYILLSQGSVTLHYADRSQTFDRLKEESSLSGVLAVQSAANTRGLVIWPGAFDSEIYSNSLLKLKAYQQEAKLDLPIGKARFKVETRKGKALQIRTAHAAVGIRGTEFVVESTGGVSKILTLEGKVSFQDLAGQGPEALVGQGFASALAKGGKPELPQAVDQGSIQQILQQDTGANWGLSGLDKPQAKALGQESNLGQLQQVDLLEKVTQSSRESAKTASNQTQKSLTITIKE